MLCASSSVYSVADEKISSQRFEEAAHLWSELEALIIFVTLRKTFLLAVLLIATEIWYTHSFRIILLQVSDPIAVSKGPQIAHVTYQRLWCIVNYQCKDVKKTIIGHIHRLWPFTNSSWVTSTFILSVMDPQQTLPTSLWHLTKIFTFQTSSLAYQVNLTSIIHQNIRKSKLLSWIVNAEYILHNERNNTIWLNKQHTRACL